MYLETACKVTNSCPCSCFVETNAKTSPFYQVGPRQKAVIMKMIIIQVQTAVAKSVIVVCFEKMIVVQNTLVQSPKVPG